MNDNDEGNLVHFEVDTSSGGFTLTGEPNSESSGSNDRATVNAIQVIEKVFYVATSTTAPHAAANALVSTDISAADSDVTGEFLQFSMSIVAPSCEVLLIVTVFLVVASARLPLLWRYAVASDITPCVVLIPASGGLPHLLRLRLRPARSRRDFWSYLRLVSLFRLSAGFVVID